MEQEKTITGQIPQLLSIFLVIIFTSGAVYSMAYWLPFGINPFEYADLSFISASAASGLIPVATQAVILGIVFIWMFSSGYVKSLKSFYSAEPELEKLRKEVQARSAELTVLKESERRLGKDLTDDLIERRISLEAEHKRQEEELNTVSENHRKYKQELILQRRSLRKSVAGWLVLSITFVGILFYRADGHPTLNPYAFVHLPVLLLGALIGVIIISEFSANLALSRGVVLEAMISTTLIFSLLISSAFAGYAKSYEILSKDTKKFIYNNDDEKKYIYLGVLNEQLILFDPCTKMTLIKGIGADSSFSIAKAKWEFHCRR